MTKRLTANIVTSVFIAFFNGYEQDLRSALYFSLAFIKKFLYNIFIFIEEVTDMPNIRSSADLRNCYNEISSICHRYNEPVFITKNGKGDLAVMSIEAYEELLGRFELYSLLQDGIKEVNAGNTRPFSEALADIRAKRSK